MKIQPRTGFQVSHATKQMISTLKKKLIFFSQKDVILSERISHPIKVSNKHPINSSNIPKKISLIRLVEHHIPKIQYATKTAPSFIFSLHMILYILESSSYFYYTIFHFLCQSTPCCSILHGFYMFFHLYIFIRCFNPQKSNLRYIGYFFHVLIANQFFPNFCFCIFQFRLRHIFELYSVVFCN